MGYQLWCGPQWCWRVAVTIALVGLVAAGPTTTGVNAGQLGRELVDQETVGVPRCPGHGDNDAIRGISSSRRPVVLVHGWDGQASAMNPVRDGLTRRATPGLGPYLEFDYGSASEHWAAQSAIAACLADYLHAVSDAYVNAGGDGRLLVVAHSMGGLAVRFATNGNYAADPVDANVLGGLVSLDTPYLGSPFGNQAIARAAEATIGKHPIALWPAPAGTDASVCLAPHGAGLQLPAGCATAPYLPPAVSITQVSADITLRRSLFGFHLYDIDLGSDAIVPISSSAGYPASGPPDATGHVNRAPLATDGALVNVTTEKCAAEVETVAQALASSGVQTLLHKGNLVAGLLATIPSTDPFTIDSLASDKYGPNVWPTLAGAYLAAPCSHSGLLSYPRGLDDAAQALHTMDEHLSSQAARLYLPCGTVADSLVGGLQVQVTVVQGKVSCAAALNLVEAYYNLPPEPLQGSGGFVMIGEWGCISTSGTDSQATGHYGECQRRNEPADISLDRPGLPLVPSPVPTAGASVPPVQLVMLDGSAVSASYASLITQVHDALARGDVATLRTLAEASGSTGNVEARISSSPDRQEALGVLATHPSRPPYAGVFYPGFVADCEVGETTTAAGLEDARSLGLKPNPQDPCAVIRDYGGDVLQFAPLGGMGEPVWDGIGP